MYSMSNSNTPYFDPDSLWVCIRTLSLLLTVLRSTLDELCCPHCAANKTFNPALNFQNGKAVQMVSTLWVDIFLSIKMSKAKWIMALSKSLNEL